MKILPFIADPTITSWYNSFSHPFLLVISLCLSTLFIPLNFPTNLLKIHFPPKHTRHTLTSSPTPVAQLPSTWITPHDSQPQGHP